jgi:RNA polymerase sigma factor (sigma-70 family)
MGTADDTQPTASRPTASGPADDFDSFFRSVFPKAVAVAQRVTGERAAAEDAALDALAKAHFRWRKIGGEPWREMWALRVAVNEAIRRLPRARAIEQLPATKDPADDVALRRTLTVALGKLPRRQCEVIVLRYLLGYSEAQVASALGISHGTVKTHLHRGMSALRGTLGQQLKEEHFARIT